MGWKVKKKVEFAEQKATSTYSTSTARNAKRTLFRAWFTQVPKLCLTPEQRSVLWGGGGNISTFQQMIYGRAAVTLWSYCIVPLARMLTLIGILDCIHLGHGIAQFLSPRAQQQMLHAICNERGAVL